MPKPRSKKHGEDSDSAPASAFSWQAKPARPRRQMVRYQSAQPTLRPARKGGLAQRGAKVAARAIERGAETFDLRATLRQGFAIVAVAALVGGVWELFRLPMLTVTASTVSVVGNERLAAEDVFAQSGLEGRSIFLIDRREARANVMALEGVSDARVRLRLPNFVRIEVMERTPFLAWQTDTETLWFAGDGTVVPQHGDAPTLTLVDPARAAEGKGGALRSGVLADLKALHQSYPDLAGEYYYGLLEGLYFTDPGGWTVYLGDGGRLDEKVSLLTATDQKLYEQGRRAQIVDLRFEGQAFLR